MVSEGVSFQIVMRNSGVRFVTPELSARGARGTLPARGPAAGGPRGSDGGGGDADRVAGGPRSRADRARDLLRRGDLPAGDGAHLRSLLAVPGPRVADPQSRRLLHHLHGRGPGA